MQGKQPVILLTAFLLAGLSSPGLRGAGSNASEEAAIRRQIAIFDSPAGGRDLYMSDRVFWSGAYKRPVMGTETSEPTGGERSIPNRVPGSQKGKTEPIRIVVADSRDVAWEYSRETLEYDLKSGQHVRIEDGVLRVWQKQNGEWKIAAAFLQPYDRVPAR